MAIMKVDMANLKLLDEGRLAAAFEHELKHVLLDLEDRPGDDRPRNITMKVNFKPIVDDRGYLESVKVSMDVGSKLPHRKTRVYDMSIRKSPQGPMLVVNELSLDDVRQDTLPFDNDKPES